MERTVKEINKDGKLVLDNGDILSLEYANLKGADLRGVNLESARLWLANLENADLEGANLESAFLWCANLESANLRYVKFESANLKSADFGDYELVLKNKKKEVK